MLNGKFRIPEIVFGALISSLLWAGIWGLSDSYAPTERQKQECYEQAKTAAGKTEECKSLWERTTSDPVAFFTFILSISTIGLWGATVGLYFAGERQIKVAKESADAAKRAADALPQVERAYIFIVPELEFWDPRPHSSGVGTYSSRVGVKFRIANHGKTPALIESIDARLRILLEAPDNRTHLNMNLEAGEQILEAGRSAEPYLSPRNYDVSEPEADAIRSSKAAIWFYGSILYWDMFGKEHWTRFRWCYSEILEIFTPRGEAPYNERT